MNIRYKHTNIITTDWKKLAKFYIDTFDCSIIPPERNQSGQWLDRGTGLIDAHIQGVHLRLPGFDDNGPTLEIFQYSKVVDNEIPTPNQKGYGHIAFQVENIKDILNLAIQNGAKTIGKISDHMDDGVGHLTFIYISDPDGNIIELQNWS